MKTDKKKKTGSKAAGKTASARSKGGAPSRKKPLSRKAALLKRKPAKPTKKKSPTASAAAARAPAPNEPARQLARKIAGLVLEKKATDVVVLDVRGIASYADYVVIASGESDRQVTAMADGIQLKLKEEGLHVVGSEGQESGQWVLLDYGDVVAHLFHTDARGHYDLEGLWADAPREALAVA